LKGNNLYITSYCFQGSEIVAGGASRIVIVRTIGVETVVKQAFPNWIVIYCSNRQSKNLWVCSSTHP